MWQGLLMQGKTRMPAEVVFTIVSSRNTVRTCVLSQTRSALLLLHSNIERTHELQPRLQLQHSQTKIKKGKTPESGNPGIPQNTPKH
eukprot:5188938-Amphidinium_carterae.1